MFKFVDVHDLKTSTEILVKISPKKDIQFFSDSEDVNPGKETINKLKSDESLLDEIFECKKRSTIKDFLIVPIH